jgi:hypothetical protein
MDVPLQNFANDLPILDSLHQETITVISGLWSFGFLLDLANNDCFALFESVCRRFHVTALAVASPMAGK